MQIGLACWSPGTGHGDPFVSYLRSDQPVTWSARKVHGIGPVPVTLAEHLMQDALLRLIVTGTDVTKVSSERRYVPDPVRRALFARDKGACVVPGCGCTRYLELHHFVTDFARGGPTAYDNLAHVCGRHHALATHCGWTLHLTDDGWELRPPGDGDTERAPP